MATVYKPKGRAKYTIEYFDENGRRRKKTGAPDKSVSERIGREIENQVALRREGLVNPRDEKYRAHEAKPLDKHLEDFVKYLEAKGGTENHRKVTATRIKRILTLTGFKRISDLSVSKALDATQRIREQGFNQQTVNHHIRAVKGFSRWLWRDGRAREHELAHLATANPEADRRRIRRALTPQEAARIIQAAESGRIAGGLTGPDRAILYALAAGTGFRRDELKTLTPDRFRLDADPPTVTVLACYSKNGHEAVQPLAQALADRLAPWIALKPPGRPVFDGMTKRTADMLRVDLEAAGIAYENDSGVIDFHALRGTYISHLVSSGASVKTCQTLARHSSPVMTIGIYAKASLHDIAGAVESLPDLTPETDSRESLASTGTDGKLVTARQTTVDESQAHVLQLVASDTAQDLGSCTARCAGSTPASRIQPTEDVSMRPDTVKRKGKPSSTFDHQLPPSRHSVSRPSQKRPQTATQNATQFPPDLAAIVAAWDGLPEAIKAGIVAMVRAAGKE